MRGISVLPCGSGLANNETPKSKSCPPVKDSAFAGLPPLAEWAGPFRDMNNWYANLLLDPRWLAKRKEQLALDRYKCVSCGRGNPDVSLCVHHTTYVTAWMPWDYPSTMLQTLCVGCHNGQHGNSKPIYAVCHLCGTLTPEKDINGRDGKHEWICETCITKSVI